MPSLILQVPIFDEESGTLTSLLGNRETASFPLSLRWYDEVVDDEIGRKVGIASVFPELDRFEFVTCYPLTSLYCIYTLLHPLLGRQTLQYTYISMTEFNGYNEWKKNSSREVLKNKSL
jgi:hypothetical protein